MGSGCHPHRWCEGPRCCHRDDSTRGSTPSGDQAAPAGELRALTGLRIVAALWVVGFHFHFTALPGVAAVNPLLGPLITQGALGVDLFFVISGFVIAHTHLDRLGPALRPIATARFVWARLCRMWPLYLVVLHVFGLWLVAKLVWGHDGTIAFQAVQPVVSVGEWLRQLAGCRCGTTPFLDGASWVGPTWSLSAPSGSPTCCSRWPRSGSTGCDGCPRGCWPLRPSR